MVVDDSTLHAWPMYVILCDRLLLLGTAGEAKKKGADGVFIKNDI